MSKGWKVGFVFVGVFLAGAVVGGLVSLRVAGSYVQKRGPEQFAIIRKGQLQEGLSLRPEQKPRIDAIVDQASDEWGKLRRETMKVFQAMEAQILDELDSAQRQEFAEMQRRWRERRQRPPTGKEEPPKDGSRREGEGFGTKGVERPPPPPPPR